MLSDKVQQEQQAALTQGELKAAELSAKERMTQVHSGLKAYADKGEIPASQLPFFQQGFSRRTGRELALGELAPALEARFTDASKLGREADPETILADTLKEFRAKLPAGDIFANAGFDQQAEQIANSFRQRTGEAYRRNYEEAGRLRIADESTDLLAGLVSADPDAKDGARAQFRAFFDGVKADELPKHEVAPFLLEKSVAPLVRDLASRGRFDDAEEVLDELETFDITGQGGLMGATAAGRATFATLRNQVAEMRRTADDEVETYAKKVRGSQLKGNSAAKAALVSLGDERLTYAKREELVGAYKKEHGADSEAVFSFQDFLDDYMRRGPRPDDETAVAGVSRLMDTTNTEQLSKASDLLTEQARAGLVSPATELKLGREIEKRRALSGLVTDEDTRLAERTIYRAEAGLDDASRPTVLPVFASGADYLSEKLTPEQRLQHRQTVVQFYRDTLSDKLRSGSFASVEAAQAALPQLRAQTITEAVAYADKLTATFLPKPAESSPPAQPSNTAAKPGVSAKPAKAPEPDPLAGVVTAQAEPRFNDPMRNRAAFLSFFTDPFTDNAPWPSSGRLQGLTPTLKDTGKFFPAAERLSAADEAAYQEKLKPVLLYKAVKTDYLGLLTYRERGSDNGDPNYIKRLRAFAENLKTYGGAEYLTPEQLSQIGLKPEAFPTVGTRAGLIR